MGREIQSRQFAPEDFEQYAARLRHETEKLEAWSREGWHEESGYLAGFELEAWLLDRHFLPVAGNDRFLERMNDPFVVPELSKFNIELNGTPQPLEGQGLRRLENELIMRWRRCFEVAHELETTRSDLMLEAATTSFQVHLQVPASEVARYYNASIVLSAPMLALAANSPYLFGRSLWDETRIPVFEQAVDTGDDAHPEQRRVTFGSGYLADDALDYFRENLESFPVLLPIAFDDDGSRLQHLRLQNGTIWRWNRLLVGFDDAAAPSLRIEHRVMPAGPTIADIIANAAVYFGAARFLAGIKVGPESDLPFATARTCTGSRPSIWPASAPSCPSTNGPTSGRSGSAASRGFG